MDRLILCSDVHVGRGAAAELPGLLKARGFARIGVIVDRAVADLPPAGHLMEALRRHGLAIVHVYGSSSAQEPTYDYLDEVAAKFRGVEMDALLGIGGGSALDLAKGVGILRLNPGRGIDYRGMNKVPSPGVPTVLVPTTAGTGSEATWTASFIDAQTNTKLGINGRHVACLFAVLDPEFVATCPASATVSAGLDALVHAIEAVTCKTAHPLSVLLGCEAVRLMFLGLPAAVQSPADLTAREQTLLGSHYAGLAMFNAGGGPASGISYPLGVHHGVPHGFAGGVLLPHVVAFNVEAGYADGYAAIHDRLDTAAQSLPAAARARSFSKRLFELCEVVHAPKTFTGFRVGRADLPRLVELTMKERVGNLELNPVPFGEKDVARLLECVLE
jgi:alcohol dehydrogenase